MALPPAPANEIQSRLNELAQQLATEFPPLEELVADKYKPEDLQALTQSDKTRDKWALIQRRYVASQYEIRKQFLKEHAMPFLVKRKAIPDKQMAKWKKEIFEATKARIIMRIHPLHRKCVRSSALIQFLNEQQPRLNCTLLSRHEISKIIPHLNLERLYDKGRLRGALHREGAAIWYYAKEDAERIAQEEAKLIARLIKQSEEREIEKLRARTLLSNPEEENWF